MKKLFKFLFINIFVIIVIFLLFDFLYYKYIFFCYVNDCKNRGVEADYDDGKYKTYKIFSPQDKSSTNVVYNFLEQKLYQNTIKPEIIPPPIYHSPIILFGDSYTWLDADIGLQKQLSIYTKRIVYNFSFWCWGATHFYYLTHNENLYKILENDKNIPSLAMYTYIRDHERRLDDVKDYFVDVHPYLTYKNINGKLVEQNKSFLSKLPYRFFTFRYIKSKLNEIMYVKNQLKKTSENYEMLYQLISQCYFELKKHYPNIKFVFFYYYQGESPIEEEEIMINKLKNIGIYCIRTTDLTNENLSASIYTQPDGYHPNKNAWDIICKPLSIKLEEIINKENK